MRDEKKRGRWERGGEVLGVSSITWLSDITFASNWDDARDGEHNMVDFEAQLKREKGEKVELRCLKKGTGCFYFGG